MADENKTNEATTTPKETSKEHKEEKKHRGIIAIGILFIWVMFSSLIYAGIANIFFLPAQLALLLVELVATYYLLEIFLWAIEGPSRVKNLFKKVLPVVYAIGIFLFYLTLVAHIGGGSLSDSIDFLFKRGGRTILFNGSTLYKYGYIEFLVVLCGIWLSWQLAPKSKQSIPEPAQKKSSKKDCFAFSILAVLVAVLFLQSCTNTFGAYVKRAKTTEEITARKTNIETAKQKVENRTIMIAMSEMVVPDRTIVLKKGQLVILTGDSYEKGAEQYVEVIPQEKNKLFTGTPVSVPFSMLEPKPTPPPASEPKPAPPITAITTHVPKVQQKSQGFITYYPQEEPYNISLNTWEIARINTPPDSHWDIGPLTNGTYDFITYDGKVIHYIKGERKIVDISKDTHAFLIRAKEPLTFELTVSQKNSPNA